MDNITEEKIVYIAKDQESLQAEAIRKMSVVLYDEEFEKAEQQLWKTLLLFEDFVFYTAKGLEFVYKIKGNEIFSAVKKNRLRERQFQLR